MAKSKKSATTRPKKLASMDGKARVVKRPSRGFHRFRGGMLNVTPKGGEKELVRGNQNSPLLRLPPEIRARIWELVLGGNILRSCHSGSGDYRQENYRFNPPVSQPLLGLDLLRLCRQAYFETALLPYKMNTFHFDYIGCGESDAKYLKPFQRAEIVDIQLDTLSVRGLGFPFGIPLERIATEGRYRRYTLEFLPSLKRVKILTFENTWSKTDYEQCKDNVRKQLDVLLAGRHVDVSFEKVQETWSAYVKKRLIFLSTTALPGRLRAVLDVKKTIRTYFAREYWDAGS
ncbi:hypothetical protein BKA63DRAFT_593897 [Paraphoma chrysanthemicola]|nr:hypothetical protein BKA63DRAFT_593897 [Paraphoma chrysanthemicola]